MGSRSRMHDKFTGYLKKTHGLSTMVANMMGPEERAVEAFRYAARKQSSPARVTTLKKLAKMRYMMNGVK